MTVTVGQLIEAQAARLVGREDERAILHRVMDADGPLVVFVHGLAGVGKSTLVQAFAPACDRAVVRTSSRHISQYGAFVVHTLAPVTT